MREPLVIDPQTLRAAITVALHTCEKELGPRVRVEIDYYRHPTVDDSLEMTRRRPNSPSASSATNTNTSLSRQDATRDHYGNRVAAMRPAWLTPLESTRRSRRELSSRLTAQDDMTGPTQPPECSALERALPCWPPAGWRQTSSMRAKMSTWRAHSSMLRRRAASGRDLRAPARPEHDVAYMMPPTRSRQAHQTLKRALPIREIQLSRSAQQLAVDRRNSIMSTLTKNASNRAPGRLESA